MDTMIKSDNPLASLLRQALDLTENTTGIPVDIDYEAISRAAIKAAAGGAGQDILGSKGACHAERGA